MGEKEVIKRGGTRDGTTRKSNEKLEEGTRDPHFRRKAFPNEVGKKGKLRKAPFYELVLELKGRIQKYADAGPKKENWVRATMKDETKDAMKKRGRHVALHPNLMDCSRPGKGERQSTMGVYFSCIAGGGWLRKG